MSAIKRILEAQQEQADRQALEDFAFWCSENEPDPAELDFDDYIDDLELIALGVRAA